MELEEGRIGTIDIIQPRENIYLESGISIFYALTDTAEFQWDNQRWTVKEGNIIAIQGSGLISIRSGQGGLVRISFNDKFTRFFALNDYFIECTPYDSKKITYQHLTNMISKLIRLVWANFNIDKNVYLSNSIGILQYVIDNFGRKIGNNKLDIKDIINYMRINYSENLDLVNTAEVFNVTPQYFSKFFKDKHGNNFSQELNDIRIGFESIPRTRFVRIFSRFQRVSISSFRPAVKPKPFDR